MSNDRMPWFKWWDGTASDMKLRMVADDCQLPMACIIGCWAYVLEHASRASERGSITGLDLELMAYTLQIPNPETVCNAMKRRKLVTEDGYIAKWEERQAKRERSEAPGASTARVQKMRALKKAQQDNDLGDDDDSNDGETGVTHVTPGNATKHPKRKRKSREDIKPKPSSSAGADGGGEEPPEEPPPAEVKPFDQFWDVYPRRVAKAEAQKAWAKLKLDSKVAEIVAAVLAQVEGHDFKRDDGQFIPHPATWLRAGRWLDEVRPWVPPPPKMPNGWWETHEGAKAAGAMLTPPLEPMKGEYLRDFVQRVRAALGQVDQPPPQATMAPPVVAPYTPPAPPEGVELTDEQRQARREELREAMAKMKQAGNLAAAGIQDAAEQPT